jgi:hypothetical protein
MTRIRVRNNKNYEKEKDKSSDTENEITKDELNEFNDIELDKISKSKIFDNFYNYSNKFVSYIFKTSVFLFKISGIYMLWICLHYFSAHLYIKFCVPNSIIGFIMSPFMISTPHCQGLRWIVYNAANIINHMWILIGAWIYSVIWIMGTNKSTNET